MNFSGKRILVTGGSGFIGRQVVRALTDAGATGPRGGTWLPHPDPAVDVVIGDISDPAAIEQALRRG